MLLEIKQPGGIIQSLFTPVERKSFLDGLPRGRSSSSSKKEDDFIEKEIIKLITETGVKSDKRVFVQEAYSFLNSAKNTHNSSDGTNTVDIALAKLLAVEELVNTVRQNNIAYEEAKTRIETKNTGSDVALTSNGKIYVDSEEGVDTITVAEYKKHSDRYHVLNNSELLTKRYHDTNLAGRIDIFTDISNSVGIREVINSIEEGVKDIGSQKRKGHSIKTTAEVRQGLEGLYNIYSETPNSHVSKDLMLSAIKYLKNTQLNQNERNVLEVTAELHGTTAEELIYETLYLNTSTAYNEELDGSGSSGNGSGTGANLKTELSFGESVLMNYGLPMDTDLILGGSLKYTVPGYVYPTIENAGDGPLPTTQTLSDTFANLQTQGILYAGKPVYFGNLRLNNIASAGRDILIDNTEGARVVYLPVNARGELSFTMMNQMQKIQDKIAKDRITDEETLKELWESNGFKYDEDRKVGTPYGYTLRPFWVQEAYTTEGTETFLDPFGTKTSPLEGNKFVEKVDDSIVEGMVESYNQKHGKNKVSIDAGWGEHSYRGMIFIPVNGDLKSTAIAAGHAYVPKTDIRHTHAAQQAVIRGGGYDNGYFNRDSRAQNVNALK